jgi:hypothetical protein
MELSLAVIAPSSIRYICSVPHRSFLLSFLHVKRFVVVSFSFDFFCQSPLRKSLDGQKELGEFGVKFLVSFPFLFYVSIICKSLGDLA